MAARIVGRSRQLNPDLVPQRCHCDKTHPRDLDIAGATLPPLQCEEDAYWFWRGHRTHCSACHILEGDEQVPVRDMTPEFARLTAGIPDEVLEEWRYKQLDALFVYAEELRQKLNKNWASLEEANPGLKSAVWEKLWVQEAKFVHVFGDGWLCDKVEGMRFDHGVGTIGAINRSGHILVCPRHGIEGVSEDDWPRTILLEAPAETSWPVLYNSLSQRGWITGEPPGAWMRQCEACLIGPITAMGQALCEKFRELRRKAA